MMAALRAVDVLSSVSVFLVLHQAPFTWAVDNGRWAFRFFCIIRVSLD
jgi:hypothetical protein